MNRIVIQEEIKADKKFVDKVIEDYKKVPKKYFMGIGEWSGDRDDIIKEIKKLSEVGKQILLMKYKFKKWEKSKLEEMKK